MSPSRCPSLEEDDIEEILTYCDFPAEHWTRIRTNNAIERRNRKIRRRTRVIGSFPDSNAALMLVCDNTAQRGVIPVCTQPDAITIKRSLMILPWRSCTDCCVESAIYYKIS